MASPGLPNSSRDTHSIPNASLTVRIGFSVRVPDRLLRLLKDPLISRAASDYRTASRRGLAQQLGLLPRLTENVLIEEGKHGLVVHRHVARDQAHRVVLVRE
jgi:hypothetical protein